MWPVGFVQSLTATPTGGMCRVNGPLPNPSSQNPPAATPAAQDRLTPQR